MRGWAIEAARQALLEAVASGGVGGWWLAGWMEARMKKAATVRARVEAAASGDRGTAVDVEVDVGRSRLEDKV